MAEMTTAERSDNATAQLLIELAFALPKGTDMSPTGAIGQRLLAFKKAVADDLLEAVAEQCDRLEEMVRVVEWVRQSAGSKYACPWCHGITERDGGPGRMGDCPWVVVVERGCRAHTPKEADRAS